MSSSFLALYRGPSVPQAKLIAVSADPCLVSDFATRLLDSDPLSQGGDPVLRATERGRRHALHLIACEGKPLTNDE